MLDGFAETWLNIFVYVLSSFSSYSNCRITPLLSYISSCCYFLLGDSVTRRMVHSFAMSSSIDGNCDESEKYVSNNSFFSMNLFSPDSASCEIKLCDAHFFFFSNSHIFPPFRANIRWIIADFHLYPCDVSLLLNLLSSAMKRFTNWFRNSVEQHD